MKLKLEMLTGMSGPKVNVTRGDDYPCDITEAARMVRGGLAKTTNAEDEKAVAEAIESLDAEEATAAEHAAELAEKKPAAKKTAKK